MANIIKRVWNQNRMVLIEDLRGMTFQAEAAGHTFQISGIDDEGNTVALTGTPSGVFLRPDNTDVALTCSVSGGVVSATLPANCYDVPGRFGLTIFITSGSSKTAIYAAVGTVTRTSSGTVAPGTSQSVVDLINAINAAVNSIPASYSALLADIAPTYSNSALYSVGQYAWYDGDLKRCIVPITTAESYTAAHWTSAVLGQDVSDLKSALTSLEQIAAQSYKPNLGFVRRNYNDTGYVEANNRLATNPLSAGKYSIPALTGTSYQYVVYKYISDTSGELLYNSTTSAREFTTTVPIVIVARHNTSGLGFTDDEVAFFNTGFNVQYDNSENVIYAKKTEVETAIDGVNDALESAVDELNDEIDESVDGINDGLSWFTEKKAINIFDGTFPNSGYFDANGADASSSSYKRTDYIPIDGSESILYFLRTNEHYVLAACFYNENKVNIGNRFNVFSSTGTTRNFTIPANTAFIRMYTSNADYTGSLMLSYDYYPSYVEPGDKYIIKDHTIAFNQLTEDVQKRLAPLSGKTVAFMGDSIIGNFYDNTGICKLLESKTGGTFINCAFGGTRMGYRYGSNIQYTYWNALSGAGLADAIASGVWTDQDTAVANITGGLAYFADRLANIKAVDWSKVDFIMWEYGTNDFTTEVELENNSDPTDMYAYANAYRHAIETILTAYPNIRIITATPTWRFFENSGVYVADSNTYEVNDYKGVARKLTAFVSKAQDISREYQIPCIDDYYTLGANKFTRLQFFNSTDGTHPNENGRKLLADHIAAQLGSLI